MEATESRLARWEGLAEWPLAAIAALFLVLYSVQVLASPQGFHGHVVQVLLALLYVPFAVDYVVRLVLAKNRGRWFVRHLLDLAVVALPFLRPLRILRLVVLVAAVQRAFGDVVRGGVVIYTAVSATLLVYASSLAVLQAERSVPGARITSFGDAVWWAITTITTVGYGDLYPVTVMGRTIAVLLMVGGISLIGTITATVAAWIVGRVAAQDGAQRAATVAHIEDLQAHIKRLTELVEGQDRIGAARQAT